ncbi:hypothetical protein [Mesorhizobium sp. M0013]|uniref:hypothetical protein n=1 Tax=Mesorhizobium sp. M0013 TaxID=2956841 RepID=UPI00333ADBCD
MFKRAQAAHILAELLKSDSDDTHSVIIAHSHGANVALKALADSGLKLTPFRVVTLAAPFIHVFARWFNPSFGSAFWPTLLCVIQLLMYFGSGLLAYFSWFQRAQPGNFEHAMIVGAMLLPSLILSVPITRFLFNPGPPRGISGTESERPWLWRPFRIARAVNYISDTEHGPKILVLRGVDDEASLVLAFGSIGARLSHEIRNVIERKIFIWIVIALPLLDYIVLQMGGTNFAALFVTTVPPIILGLIFLPGLFYSVFGREFAFGSIRCELSANSSPDSERVKVITLPIWDSDILGGLRHSVYNHPYCVPQIVLWLLEEEVLDNLNLKVTLKMLDWKRRMDELIRSKGGGDPAVDGETDELLEGMSNVLTHFVAQSRL